MKITKSQHYQLTGLLFMAHEHEAKTREIITAMREITKEDDDFGHCADAVYGPCTIKELYRKIGIEVGKS